VFVVIFLLSLSGLGHAASFERQADLEKVVSAESLTSQLLNLAAQQQLTRSGSQAEPLRTVAANRKQLLKALIESNPAKVLQLAIPADVRAGLPSEVQPYIEEHLEAEGDLEVLVEDYERESRVLYFLLPVGKKGGRERLSLHFAAQPPSDLQTGSRVRVKGVQIDQAVALESGGYTSVEMLVATLSSTLGEQKTLVILVNFQDRATQPYTLDYARNVVFHTTSNFDLENSYQQTWLTGDVVGWYTIPLTSTGCDPSQILSLAQAAATAAGVNLSSYNHWVIAFPGNACGWWGLGTVGGNPSVAWINGSLELMVVGHEMGHNFGLFHSHSLDCGSEVVGTSCTQSEYGDTVDIMGCYAPGHFNAYQKGRLGWLNAGASPPLTTVTTTGAYTIDALETPGIGPKALKISRPGQTTFFYVEYRKASGFDSFLSSYPNILNGVVIHQAYDADSNSSNLLDLTPSTASWYDPALTVGNSFTDPVSGVTVTTTAVNGTSASVYVNYGGGPTCVHANPSVTMAPTQIQAVKGTQVTYSVSVTNHDTACPPASFSLQASVPNGWASVLAPTVSLNPGASTTTTFKVTSSASATNGSYPVGVTAKNTGFPAYTASASATYVVSDGSQPVTVSTDRSIYSLNQQVAITATVKAGGSPVQGARAAITVRRPDGSVAGGMTPHTGADGTAKVVGFRPNKTGTYQVKAVVDKNGVVLGSATANFTVK
jgi:hypothetical protein